MSTKSEFSVVGLAHKLLLAAEEQGYTPELINALAEKPNLLKSLLQAQLGYAEFKLVEHVIDCDASPFVPDGWKVEEHQKGGQFKFDASQIELHLSAAQKKGSIEGNKLRRELVSKPVLNANVLDYLLTHTELIPEDWKGKAIFFWGTIYRGSSGLLYVRFLCWSGGRWGWNDCWLDYDWGDSYPAALRAS